MKKIAEIRDWCMANRVVTGLIVVGVVFVLIKVFESGQAV